MSEMKQAVKCRNCQRIMTVEENKFSVGPLFTDVLCYPCWDYANKKHQPNTVTTTGLQTPIEESYTAIPPLALAKVARVMSSGTRKYGVRNWDRITVADHLDHAIRHGYLYVMGDTTDEPDGITHLAHMACRALMALEVEMLKCYNSSPSSNAPTLPTDTHK